MAGIAAAVDVSVFDNRKHEGRIANKRGTQKLYFDFFYHGTRIEKSTGLNDTPENRRKAETMLEQILAMKRDGVLEFTKLFPGASEEEKEFHTHIEKGEYAPTPKAVLFGDYVKKWYTQVWSNYPQQKQQDFKSVIEFRLLPYFKNMSFFHITGVTLQKFVATLVHRDGPNVGKKLARSTMVNTLQIFKTVWDDAVVEHCWMIFDPLKGIKKSLPKKGKKKVDVFRFHEWETILAAMDEFYHPVAKLMVLTGMIASEIAAIKRQHIRDGYLYVEESIVREVEKDELKNGYRERRIPITKAIADILDYAQSRTASEYLWMVTRSKQSCSSEGCGAKQ